MLFLRIVQGGCVLLAVYLVCLAVFRSGLIAALGVLAGCVIWAFVDRRLAEDEPRDPPFGGNSI
ncbi:MAG: hypothetical protein HYT40_01570 [Candidatus Sungbacteria bacterium]|uniref:Uncharacterized protein n=1 Tax=Candidatus Sungiibacteriota bacterium TaxID=2750080 RepID=A0A931SCH6_9BACT|nr:hypothetical protein [Candidatus Sungbacteria bacterium]